MFLTLIVIGDMKISTVIKHPKLLLNSHFWFELKDSISCFFKPKQEWLTEVIPDTWCDKVELVPRLLFTCLVHYIEVERKREWIYDVDYDWSDELKKGQVSQDYVDSVQLRDKQLMKAYEYIKTGRKHMEDRIDAAYPPSQSWDEMFAKDGPKEDGYYELVVSDERLECYKEVHRLEAIKLEKDKECMRIIIKNHEHLWT